MILNKTAEAFKKNITLLCFISAIIIPILNNFVLSLVLSNIAGDIMYATIAEILSAFVKALDLVNLFFVYGVLVNCLVRLGFKNSKNIIALCFLRIFIIYASFIAIGAIVTTDFTTTIKSNLIYCITNGLIDIMLLVGAAVLCMFLCSKYLGEGKTNITVRKFIDMNNPLLIITLWVTVLISAFLLSGCVINTVTDIATYGADNLNTYEVIYLVAPYIKWILKFIVGYTVMFFTSKLFGSLWKKCADINVKQERKMR